jgi:hypothetical protein
MEKPTVVINIEKLIDKVEIANINELDEHLVQKIKEAISGAVTAALNQESLQQVSGKFLKQ